MNFLAFLNYAIGSKRCEVFREHFLSNSFQRSNSTCLRNSHFLKTKCHIGEGVRKVLKRVTYYLNGPLEAYPCFLETWVADQLVSIPGSFQPMSFRIELPERSWVRRRPRHRSRWPWWRRGRRWRTERWRRHCGIDRKRQD